MTADILHFTNGGSMETPETGSFQFNELFEIELSFLGCLVSNNTFARQVKATVAPHMFAHPTNGRTYDLIVKAVADGGMDFRLLASALPEDWFSGEWTKGKYLARIMGAIVTVVNAPYYAEHIVASYRDRTLYAILSDTTLTPDERTAQYKRLWRETTTASGRSGVALTTAADRAIAAVDNAIKTGGMTGLRTGMAALDDVLCGMDDGGLYVLAGRPSMGKTALGLTIALNAAFQGQRVLFFSLEMSEEQLASRVLARLTNISTEQQRTGRIGKDGMTALLDANEVLATTPLTIFDQGGWTAEQIAAKANEYRGADKPALIVIDHLGIVKEADARAPKVYQIAEMTRTFKLMAKDMGCPVLLLHQLSRGVENREDKRPTMADLRDSGSIEQDADAVLLLYRREYYLTKSPPEKKGLGTFDYNNAMGAWQRECEANAGKAEVFIPKNRQGRDGIANLRFDGRRQFFSDVEAV